MISDDIPRRAYTPTTNHPGVDSPPPVAVTDPDSMPVQELPVPIQMRLVLQRLNRSRSMLHSTLNEGRDRVSKSKGQGSSGNQKASWLGELQNIPGANLLITAVKLWWSKHPLHMAANLAMVSGNVALEPVARRYPIVLMSVAVVAGAGLVWLRPWRWFARPALVAGILSQLTAALIDQSAAVKASASTKAS